MHSLDKIIVLNIEALNYFIYIWFTLKITLVNNGQLNNEKYITEGHKILK